MIKVYILSGLLGIFTIVSIPTINWVFGAGKVHRDVERTKDDVKELSQTIKEINEKQVEYNINMEGRLIRIGTQITNVKI